MYDIIIAVCIFIMGIAIGIWLFGGVLNSSAQGRPIGSGIITTTSAGDLCSRTEKESGRGKPVESWQQIYCSDRCRWIGEKMDTPLGRHMSTERAVRFFGKLYDREHGRDTK